MLRACVAIVIAALSAACSGPELVARSPAPAAATFDGRLLALSDGDMAGTAYADGRLLPIAAADTLSIIEAGETIASARVGNSVMAWPGALDVSPDGQFAYVVETRASPPPGVSAYDNIDVGMPEGRLLRAVRLDDAGAPTLIGELDVGRQPTSVHVAPDGRFALVSRKQEEAPIAAVILRDGAPVEVIELPFPLAVAASDPNDEGAPYVRLAPNGRDFAINVANTHVQFGRLEFDAAGAPVSATPVGPALPAGQWISMIRWSRDGRHIIVSDVAWSASQLGAVLNGPGALVSIAFNADGASRVVSRAEVSLSPEGFEMSGAGDLLIAVNMERTYLPERLPYTLFGRRAQASLSLVGFDATTGALLTIDGPLGFDAVLPEDAVFDADGDMLAVAVFHGRGEAAGGGWIDYFRIVRDGGGVRLLPTGMRTPTPRGAHDLALIAPP